MQPILANYTASVTELKKSPTQLLNKVGDEVIAILNHNVPSAYLVPSKLYEKMMDIIGYLGTFGKNATKNFKLTLKSDTLLYEPLELIFPYKDTLSTPKTISSSIS